MNDNNPSCAKCGGRADFGVSNADVGLGFTNYCHRCFAQDHPEAVKIKDGALEEMDEDYSKETFH
jgi:hypothetical protein